jgi:hypothetical protein
MITRPTRSVHRAGGHHARIKLDLTERAFVAGHVLLQDARQRLGLLRTQINALEIVDFYLGLTLLLQCAEDQEEIPDVDSYLHAVGIGLAIVGGVVQFDVGLNWVRHRKVSVAGLRQGNNAAREDHQYNRDLPPTANRLDSRICAYENGSQKSQPLRFNVELYSSTGKNGSGMPFKKAVGVGLAVATLLHVLVIARLISSMVLWPGFFAYFLISGLHGDEFWVPWHP